MCQTYGSADAVTKVLHHAHDTRFGTIGGETYRKELPHLDLVSFQRNLTAVAAD
jgi:hypothetical protein